ncbi:MAG: nicotinate-nucleotide--dimethylbenzimidazole phosphoribosyltransferase, partial [Bacillota bacterium]
MENENALQAALQRICGLDAAAMEQAKARQAKLAKPPGSLGKLESLSIQFAGIQGALPSVPLKKRVIVLCADNGVVDEGVSSAPRSVTLAQAINMTRGLT